MKVLKLRVSAEAFDRAFMWFTWTTIALVTVTVIRVLQGVFVALAEMSATLEGVLQ